MSIHIYRLTKNGKQVASRVGMAGRNRYLDYLNKCKDKTASDEQMALFYGCSKVAVRMELRRLKSLVEDMTREDGGL